MSMARFHTICDRCGSKGAEYSAHTVTCRKCGDDVCEPCAANYDPDPTWRDNVCMRCVTEEATT